MHMRETYRSVARTMAGPVAVSVALLLSGCAYSLGDFGWNKDKKQAEMSAASPPPQSAATAQVPLAANALADDTTASIAPARTGTYVNPGVPQDQPASRLLTPEEKARAMAELEALAKGQKVASPGAAGAKAAACADQTLDAAARLKLEQQGITC